MNLLTFALGPLATNSYLVHNGQKAVCIDVGGDPKPIIDALKKNSLTLEHILLTHLHFDHILGVAALKRFAVEARVLAGEKDSYLLEGELGLGGVGDLPKVENFEWTPLEPGECLYAGFKCQILSTPGHSPGSMSFYFPEEESFFAGDVIFFNSIGRTDFPGGNTKQLLATIRGKIFVLPENTTIYPGHGPSTSVAEEKIHNPFLR